jgi:hypothetical protein
LVQLANEPDDDLRHVVAAGRLRALARLRRPRRTPDVSPVIPPREVNPW